MRVAVFFGRCRRTIRIRVIGFARLAFAISLPAVPVVAQEERNDPDEQPGFVTLDELDIYLELETRFRSDRVDTNSRRRGLNLDRLGFRRDSSQTNSETRLEERIGLKLSGALLDPGFITYSGDLSFALTQDRFKEQTNSFGTLRDNQTGFLLEYDLRLNFFPGKKLSGTLYGLRQDDRINRRFQPTLDERRTGFGTSWIWADAKFPMELSFDFVETDRRGNRDKRDDENFLESRLYYSLGWNISDRQRFKFSFEHSEREQDFQGVRSQFDTIRDLFILEHELEFGDEQQHSFRTLVHWQEESGDFARDFFEIGPELILRHSKKLQTLYKYQFNRERYAGLDIETQRADFQLVHQVYTNLTTTADLFVLYEDIENDINTRQWGGSIDWQYNRKNRWGQLYANLALAYDTEQVSGDDSRRVVLDEAHTLRDPISATLYNRNVTRYSIVVTDAGNRRVYQLGLDYYVYRQGNTTRISRVRNGRIAEGDTILVDYQYSTPTDGKLDTVRVDFSIEQRFTNGWRPYYRFAYRNQEDDTSFGFARRADRTDHHRLGLKYEKKRFSYGVEYEVFDDSVDPFDAFHLTGLLHIIATQEHTLDFSSRFSRFDFTNGFDDRSVTMIDVDMDHRWRLDTFLSTVSRVGYRLEEDSLDGTTQGWDISVGLSYVVGDLIGELTMEYDRLDLPRSDDESFGVYFRLRREFGNVLAQR